MKASELIYQLKDLIDEIGDLEVTCSDHYPIKEANVENSITESEKVIILFSEGDTH